MYETFGEFDSAEEMLDVIDALKEEGDFNSLKILADENGLNFHDNDVYIDTFTAAIGKLEVEKKEKAVKDYEKKIPAEPIVEYLTSRCMEDDIAKAIRKKSKSLAECLKHVEAEARKIVTKDKPYLPDLTVFNMALDYYRK